MNQRALVKPLALLYTIIYPRLTCGFNSTHLLSRRLLIWTAMRFASTPRGSDPTDRLLSARQLMDDFVQRTLPSGPRYLWTDAFAVCNLLGLSRAVDRPTDREHYQMLAVDLVDAVHDTLGRHRRDDPNHPEEWLSGLKDEEARHHPTQGGLRIGKPLPERQPHEQFNERLEWERDGQYFHYLTKWMLALDQMGRAIPEARYHQWAQELAAVSAKSFVYLSNLSHRMYWKMSADLSHPLVSSQGASDPLDGFVTVSRLLASTTDGVGDRDLQADRTLFRSMIRHSLTDDPLGLGGLMVDAYRLSQLPPVDESLVERLLEDSLTGLATYERGYHRKTPAHRRLAFRELGK